jgi:hypothetical protein
MDEHLRTDYDRMVGESYKEYAARCRGRMLAAEQDRDALAVEAARLRERRKTAAQFVEACVRRGSIKPATSYALLSYLRDAPPRETDGGA